MRYDYRKLLGRIKEKHDTQAKFAKELGLSTHSLSLKLNSKIGFKQKEIQKACKLLGLAGTDIPDYFFTLKAQ